MAPVFVRSYIIDKDLGEYREQRWLKWRKIINDDPQAGLNLYNRRNETCNYSMTYMHYVCHFGNYGEEFVKVVQPLSTKQKLTIFKQVSSAKISPLMRLIVNNPIRRSSDSAKCLKLLFENFSHNDKLDIMTMEDHNGLNAIAYAARFNSLSAIEFLLNTTEGIKFDPQQQLKLMKFSWRYDSDTSSVGEDGGYGSDEEAGVREPVSAAEVAHVNGRKESTEMLERLKVDAMIQVAVETKSTGTLWLT